MAGAGASPNKTTKKKGPPLAVDVGADAPAAAASRPTESTRSVSGGIDGMVTEADLQKARTYITQLKVQIEVACAGTDLVNASRLLEEAEDLGDDDATFVGQDLIMRLTLHVEALTLGTPMHMGRHNTLVDPEFELEPAPAPALDAAQVAAALPPSPAHRAMQSLKKLLKMVSSVHTIADQTQEAAASREAELTAVANRVPRVLDAMDKELELQTNFRVDGTLALSAATAMAELMIYGYSNPAVQAGQPGRHPPCGSQLDGPTFRRVSLTLARLICSASDDPYPVFSAAWSSGRLAQLWSSAENVVAKALRKPLQELGREDALNYACLYAADRHVPGGWVTRCRAVGLSTAEFASLYVNTELLVSQKKLPSDDVPKKMVGLLLDLIRAGCDDLPELAVGGAWRAVVNCVIGRPAVAQYAFECGVFELIVECLRAIGGPLEWFAFGKHGGDGRVIYATQVAATILRTELTQSYKSDPRFQRSGLVQEFVKAVGVLDALRTKRRNRAKLTVDTNATGGGGEAAAAPLSDLGTSSGSGSSSSGGRPEEMYSPALYFILSVLSDHSLDAEVDKLLKIVRLANKKEFTADAAFASELQRQHQQMVLDSKTALKKQAAVAKAAPVLKSAEHSWHYRNSPTEKHWEAPNIDKAMKSYSHALALDPDNKELREKTREVGAARYAKSQQCKTKLRD
jgi:hypothetical protein